MAIAVRTHHRPVAARPPWVHRRATESEGVLTALMVTVLLVGIATAILAAQMLRAPTTRGARHAPERAAATDVTDGVAPSPEVSPPAADASMGALAPAPSDVVPPVPALAVGRGARVANTDGLGVVLHAAPRAGARKPAGLFEGTAVTILELADAEWARVQSAARQDGWVPVAYLAPDG